MLASLAAAEQRASPFVNWRVTRLLPPRLAEALARLPLNPVDLGGVSGRRELHNDQRAYFAGDVLERFAPARALAEAFQSPRIVQALMLLTGALLVGTYLRIEYALDLDGFWLEPHTDLGVKAFTMLFQLGQGGQEGLGTDLYSGPGAWAETVPFGWNSALLFVPAADTWHGVEPRPIEGVRRSIIVNYVTEEWRARDQLAFPDRPVGV
ncbi:2OG-Fe(II) oxygenase [Phenylobacterium soli]|uniref:2OG-Fe(II) oxygenase n=1 Tax=Phenylobacterium soli TaxID=2170551 RepID=A0A328AP01_9CAUL|nr:2OG-Fe(II) oxygenase [Phenylobacterium soli]